jgi:hypothetical protein
MESMAVIPEIFADFRAERVLAGVPPDVTSGQLRQLHFQPNLQDN